MSSIKTGEIESFKYQGEVRYDPIIQPHAHIVCSKCDKIWDVELPKEINNLAPTNDSFENFDVDLTWKGICNDCR